MLRLAVRAAAAVPVHLPRLPLLVARAHKLPAALAAGHKDEAAVLPRARQVPEQRLLSTSRGTGLRLLLKTGLNACPPIHRVPALSVAEVEAAAVAEVEAALVPASAPEQVDEVVDRPQLPLLPILAASTAQAVACGFPHA